MIFGEKRRNYTGQAERGSLCTDRNVEGSTDRSGETPIENLAAAL
jgi:hypothetical protein